MDLTPLPDDDLVVYIKNHDLDAFSEVVVRFENKILTYTTLLLGNELSGHTVSIQAFINTYKYIHSINGRIPLKVNLFRSAHVEAHRYFKTHGTREVFDGETLLEDLFNIENVESEFSDKEFWTHLKKNIHKLDIKYREVTILYFVLNFSLNEISDILMLPLNVVEVRISEARAKLENIQ